MPNDGQLTQLTTRHRFQALLRQAAKELWQLDLLPEALAVSYPPVGLQADYASALPLRLAKVGSFDPMQRGASPAALAEAIIALWQSNDEALAFGQVSFAAPGYLNLHLAEGVLLQALRSNSAAVIPQTGQGQTALVEYSSPNIAKPMHVGHLRATVIGHVLANLFAAQGFTVARDSHVGDWGTQFGKLIVVYKEKYGDVPRPVTIAELVELYVDFHKRLEVEPALESQARDELVKLQAGDAVNRKLWQHFSQMSLAEFQKMYDRLGVRFDTQLGESFYENDLASLVSEALERQIAERSEGAVIIRLDEEGLPPFLIQKSDGAFLYSTTDLATIRYREKNYPKALVLYVVGQPQELHFRQLFASARRLGWGGSLTMEHIQFGQVLAAGGKKFSTREGNVVDAADLLDEAVRRASEVVAKAETERRRGLTDAEQQQIAECVGVGALAYQNVSTDRQTSISFDWERMLDLTGDSGPYLMYTYARLRSIERKANEQVIGGEAFKDLDASERAVATLALRFPEAVQDATALRQPSLLASYLRELASAANSFYQSQPVLQAESETRRNARLSLVRTAAEVLRKGLAVLGLPTPERL